MGIRSHVHAAVMLLAPFSWQEVDPVTGAISYQGTTLSAFLNITKALNITLQLDIIRTGAWGSRLPNGTYIGLQRLAYDGKCSKPIQPSRSNVGVLNGKRRLRITNVVRHK